MGWIDHDAPRQQRPQITVDDLYIAALERIVRLEEENERLKAHVRDLDHDLNSAIDQCNEHCGGEE